ncbi:MAG: amidohydrolase [Acidobacteria bacterium]|nr:amidohydrolase [Acidobacteriota bacterium]
MTSESNTRPTADCVYLHANIYTGVVQDQKPQRAEAMAVRGDKILAVGSRPDILKRKGPETKVVDVGGNFVMPGFNDAHMHLTEAGFKKLTVDLTGTRSLPEFQDRIRRHLPAARPGEWITGSGWDETLWPTKQLPTRLDIDTVTRDHPVFLVRVDGHVAVANSLALKIAQVEPSREVPEGGEIARSRNGDANGILRETAQSLVTRIIPPPSPASERQAIETALADIARSGITSVQDFSGGDEESNLANFKILEQLEKEGKLTVRISEWLPFDAPLEVLLKRRAAHPESDPMLHTGMLKAFMDGSLGSHTAAMLEPFADAPGNSGLARYEQSKLDQMSTERVEAGFQLGFHAIGDRAVDMALNAFRQAEQAAQASGARAPDGSGDFRLRVEHAQVTNPEEVERFRQLKVIASMQPNHLLTDMRWAMTRLGARRAAHSYAWAEFLSHGVALAFGTDYPVEPVAPFRGLYAAVTRKSEDASEEYYPEQKLTIEQAIAAYTTGSAYAEFAENKKGVLAPGMLADFVVLDRDLTAVSPEQILGTRVLETVVGGKTVYQRHSRDAKRRLD